MIWVLHVIVVAWLAVGVLWSYEMNAAERPILFVATLLLAVTYVFLVVAEFMRIAWVQRLKAVLGPAGTWTAVAVAFIVLALVVLQMALVFLGEPGQGN